MMAEASYRVRIQQPDPGEAAVLASMIAPFVELDVLQLEGTLRRGPALVGAGLPRREAEQLVRLFLRLGARAELVEPANQEEEEADDEPESPSIIPRMRQTQPFDGRALRDALNERAERSGPPRGLSPTDEPRARDATWPFMVADLQRVLGEEAPPPSSGAPTTRPLELDGAAAPPRAPLRGRPTRDPSEAPPRPLPGLVPAPPGSVPPPPTDEDEELGSVNTASLAFELNDDLPLLALDEEKPTRRPSTPDEELEVRQSILRSGELAVGPSATRTEVTEVAPDGVPDVRPTTPITRELPQMRLAEPLLEEATGRFSVPDDLLADGAVLRFDEPGPEEEARREEARREEARREEARREEARREEARREEARREEARREEARREEARREEARRVEAEEDRRPPSTAPRPRSPSTSPRAEAPRPAIEWPSRADLAADSGTSERQRAAARAQAVEQPPPRPSGGHSIPDRARAEAIRERAAEQKPLVHHEPARAALAGLLPGMGQLYNGQRGRAVAFAVASLAVVPWLYGMYDAWRTAHLIRQRRLPAPHAAARRAAVPGQLILDLAVLVAMAGAIHLLTRPPALQPARTPLAPATLAPATLAPATLAPESAAPVSTGPRTVHDLLAEGRTLCAEGRFADCEARMLELIRLRPDHIEAHRLLVDARTQQRAREGARKTLPTP